MVIRERKDLEENTELLKLVSEGEAGSLLADEVMMLEVRNHSEEYDAYLLKLIKENNANGDLKAAEAVEAKAKADAEARKEREKEKNMIGLLGFFITFGVGVASIYWLPILFIFSGIGIFFSIYNMFCNRFTGNDWDSLEQYGDGSED